jgi:hypothetical protein
VTGSVAVAGSAASGTAKAGNPEQIGGVFNTTQPTVTTGQVVEAQSTARGALIVATGVDAFNIVFAAPQHVIVDSGTLSVTQGTSPWVISFTAPQHVIVDSITAGSNIIGKVDILGNAGATLDAAVNSGAAPTNSLWSTPSPSSVAQAALTAKPISSTAQAVLKASPGNLYGAWLVNLATSTATTAALTMYVHFFNTTTTTGLTTGSWLFALPISSPGVVGVIGAGAGNGLRLSPGALGLANFSSGIVIVINTTSTSNTTAAGTAPVGVIWIE